MAQGQTSAQHYDDWAMDVLALPRQIQEICRRRKLCCPSQCVVLKGFLSSVAFFVRTHWHSRALGTTAVGKHEKRKSIVMGEKLIDVLNCGVEFLKRCAEQDSVSTLVVSIGELNWIIDSVKGYSRMMNKLLAQDFKKLQDEIESHCRTAQDLLLAAYKKDKKLMDSLIKQNASKNLTSKLEDLYKPAPVVDVLLDFDKNLAIADSVLFVESQVPVERESQVPVERAALIRESVVTCMTEFGLIHGFQIGKVSGHLKRRALILKYMVHTVYHHEYLSYGVDMMLQIATAMRYPDRYNVIHLDLKPCDNTLVQTQTQTDLQTQADSNVYSFGRLWELVIRQEWDGKDVNVDDIKAIIHLCLEPEQHKQPTFEDICNHLWDLKEKMLLTDLGGLEIAEFQEEHLKKDIQEHLEKDAYGINISKARWGNLPVAIKEFQEESDCFSEFEEYDSLTTHGLNTTHIVQVLGQVHTTHYREVSGERQVYYKPALVIELMATDLKRQIEIRKEMRGKSSPFSLNESIDIMYQIAKGVHNLHEVDAVHGDIMTASIFLDTLQDGSLIVKLTDLRNAYHKPTNCRLKNPEPWTKEEAEILREKDVRSFGVVCIEILTGVQPDLKEGKMPCLPQGIPDNLGVIILGCLEPQMENLTTFEKIYKDLGRLREQWKPIPLIPLIASSELVIQGDRGDLGAGAYGAVDQ